jgi:hypothetical protein
VLTEPRCHLINNLVLEFRVRHAAGQLALELGCYPVDLVLHNTASTGQANELP